MRILIESKPGFVPGPDTHARRDCMRYATLGDWFYRTETGVHLSQTGERLPEKPRQTLVIQVAETDEHNQPLPEKEQFLIALHELVEVKLCEARGITQKQVDDFDFAHTGDGEQGDTPGAPYAREHRFAMIVEHLMAHELDMAGYGRIE